MKYPKINTIWKRDETKHGRIIEGQYSREEFDSIWKWQISEKIDGTNIRITYENGTVRFDGRTDEAQIPANLYATLQKLFPLEKLKNNLPDCKVVLFGEGYGAKIQKGGGLYRKDVGFILFDIWLDGWWLERQSIEEIAHNLGIETVPILGVMNHSKAIELVQTKPNSIIAQEPKIIEGIVARSYPLMLFRDGTPIMWKIKVRDFDA